MRFLRKPLLLLCAFGVLAGCQPASEVKVRRKGATVGTENATGESDLTLSFTDQAFQQYKVGTTNLTYVFKYLGATFSGPIVFQGTQSSLSFKNLPTNASGDVNLEVYVNGALKMMGVQAGVTFKAGHNELQLTNFVVDGIATNSGWDGKTFQGNHLWKLEGL